jgi:hypothetical protein
MNNLIDEIVSIMMSPGVAGNGAVKIINLVLEDVELAKKVAEDYVPYVEPAWSGSTGWQV